MIVEILIAILISLPFFIKLIGEFIILSKISKLKKEGLINEEEETKMAQAAIIGYEYKAKEDEK
jgi:hypothetical protein